MLQYVRLLTQITGVEPKTQLVAIDVHLVIHHFVNLTLLLLRLRVLIKIK